MTNPTLCTTCDRYEYCDHSDSHFDSTHYPTLPPQCADWEWDGIDFDE